MADNQPHIEVMSCVSNNGALDVASVYNVDTGPLSMPKHIAIGKRGTDVGGGHDPKIMNYGDQVDEYAIWLSQQVKDGNVEVLTEIDEIFNKSITTGVILTTLCCPSPNITHAHEVKNLIMDLAASMTDG